MTATTERGNNQPAPQLSRQIALRWCVGTGGQRATSGDWMKGADGFMSHAFAAPYLEQVLKLYRKAKRRNKLWCDVGVDGERKSSVASRC